MLLHEIYDINRFKSVIGDEAKEKGHTLSTKKRYWEKPGLEAYLDRMNLDDVSISRQELYNLASTNVEDMILKTVMWGYGGGGFMGIKRKTAAGIKNIKAALEMAKEEGIPNWEEHWNLIVKEEISGVGLATYSKFLTFMGIPVEGTPALIVDRHVLNFLRSGEFKEFDAFKKLPKTDALAAKYYPQVIKGIHQVAQQVGVPANNLEMFMYQWSSQKEKYRGEMLKQAGY